MTSILKGNFVPRDAVKPDEAPESLERRFEREALKRLGGSIAFVSKQKVLWDGEESPGAGEAGQREAAAGVPED